MNKTKTTPTNDLETFLTRQYEQWKPYGSHLFTGFLAVIAVLLALNVYSYYSRQNHARAWDSFASALATGDPTVLETLRDSQKQPPDVDVRIRLTIAGWYLAEASDTAFTNRDKAVETLEKAKNHYEMAGRMAKTVELADQAMFGLARTCESLAMLKQSDEEMKQAKNVYRKLQEAGGSRAEMAGKRADMLDKPQTQQFVAKFATLVPPSPAGDLDVEFPVISDLSNLPDPGTVSQPLPLPLPAETTETTETTEK